MGGKARGRRRPEGQKSSLQGIHGMLPTRRHLASAPRAAAAARVAAAAAVARHQVFPAGHAL